jgi:endonuclease G, mitochondrial
MTRRILLLSCAVWIALSASAQNTEKAIVRAQAKADSLEQIWRVQTDAVKDLKLVLLNEWMQQYGMPETGKRGEIIRHRAMALEYDEQHEQARWVYHVIMPDIAKGTAGRSNDFRPDPKVSTGSADAPDYFSKTTNELGEDVYNGYGYDRGHLAPSADFRWHPEALSESYFYSNISPQIASFNREGWAEIEEALRSYVYNTGNPLLVVTGPHLTDDLVPISESVNGVSVPNHFFKIALDPEEMRSVAFWVPHRRNPEPIHYHMRSVREVEQLTGINFFPKLNDASTIENQKQKDIWFPEQGTADVQPVAIERLPKKSFNTDQAQYHENSGKEVRVCGTVVSTFVSRKGNLFLYLDKAYPKHHFSVFISKGTQARFAQNPEVFFKDKCICAEGKIVNSQGKPTIFLESDRKIGLMKDMAK